MGRIGRCRACDGVPHTVPAGALPPQLDGQEHTFISTSHTSLPRQFRIVAKEELFQYPFLGWHLRRSGQVPIVPGAKLASLRSLLRAVPGLKRGMPLVVFPEGGRSADGTIQPFMSGAAYIAIKAEVDIVPMAIVGTFEVLPMNSFHIRPGKIQLVVGEAISTAECTLQDAEKLSERAQRAVEGLFYARARVEAPIAKQSVTRE